MTKSNYDKAGHLQHLSYGQLFSVLVCLCACIYSTRGEKSSNARLQIKVYLACAAPPPIPMMVPKTTTVLINPFVCLFIFIYLLQPVLAPDAYCHIFMSQYIFLQ